MSVGAGAVGVFGSAGGGSGGGGGAVDSVFGRTGVVTAQNGDYTASNITNVPAGNIAATNVQTALNELDTEKQPLDATLTALAAYNTNGLLTQTAADTFVGRTLAAPAAGFTITNPAGTAGNPTFVLADDLAGLEALASTGLVARTASNTYVERTLTAPAAGFTITNPAGIAGNPTFVLADDLAALEGLGSTGIAVRTASNTWAQRTITAGSAGGVVVTNGDGVSGNPTLTNNLATKTISVFTALQNQPPAASFAVLGTRNSIAHLAFSDAATTRAVFVDILRENYTSAQNLEVILKWTAATATTGDVVWNVEFGRTESIDTDTDSWDTAVAATTTTSGTSGNINNTTLSFTNTQAADIVAGDIYRIRVSRIGGDGSDTMSGNAQLLVLQVKVA